MVTFHFSLEEAEYLKSLVRTDTETRENKGKWQEIALAVFEQIVTGRPTVDGTLRNQQVI